MMPTEALNRGIILIHRIFGKQTYVCIDDSVFLVLILSYLEITYSPSLNRVSWKSYRCKYYSYYLLLPSF